MIPKYNLIQPVLFLVICTLFYPLTSANEIQKRWPKDSMRNLVPRSITKKTKPSYKVVVTTLGTLLLMGGLVVAILLVRRQRPKERLSVRQPTEGNTSPVVAPEDKCNSNKDENSNQSNLENNKPQPNNQHNTEQVHLSPAPSTSQSTEANTLFVISPEEVDHSSNDKPEWIIPKKGINLKAVCPNDDCDSNKDEKYGSDDKVKRVLMHYDSFILSYDNSRMNCPVCKSKIKPKDVSYVLMYKCSYTLVGNLVTDDFETIKKKLKKFESFNTKRYDIKGATTKGNNHLIRLFDSDKLVYWASLILKVKDLL